MRGKNRAHTPKQTHCTIHHIICPFPLIPKKKPLKCQLFTFFFLDNEKTSRLHSDQQQNHTTTKTQWQIRGPQACHVVMAHSNFKYSKQPETAQVMISDKVVRSFCSPNDLHRELDVLRDGGLCLHPALTSITRPIPSPEFLCQVHCTLVLCKGF